MLDNIASVNKSMRQFHHTILSKRKYKTVLNEVMGQNKKIIWHAFWKLSTNYVIKSVLKF